MADDLGDLIRTVPLFRALSPAEQRVLRTQLREEWFAAGEPIIREGDTAGRFYVIARGRARENGRMNAIIGPGQFIGDPSLLDGEPHSATVKAETPVRAYSMSSLAFVSLLERNWGAAREVIGELCKRVRALESAS
jgi:CRP/FNR family transcriptional regulator, cyclic AMP receptor protein